MAIFLKERSEVFKTKMKECDLSRFSFKELKKTFHFMKSDISLFSDDPKNSIFNSLRPILRRIQKLYMKVTTDPTQN